MSSPKIVGPCKPGMCSNGSNVISADPGEIVIDQLMPCQYKRVIQSEYLGNISLHPEIYCDPKTMRGIARRTCCSPEEPNSTFPRLYLYPVNSNAINTECV